MKLMQENLFLGEKEKILVIYTSQARPITGQN